MNKITQKVYQTYQNNLNYLKEMEPLLFDNISLLDKAINLNLHEEKYVLEYKEDKYFDLLDTHNKTYFYGQDSNSYADTITKNTTYKSDENIFNAFYLSSFKNQESVDFYDNQEIDEHPFTATASLIHYTNTQSPKTQTMNAIEKFIFLGIGIGTHIEKIHQKINAQVYFIVEQDLELFRSSLFVTDYSKLAKSSKLFFSIAQSTTDFSLTFNSFLINNFIHNHFLKFNMFSQSAKSYLPLIQAAITLQPKLTYPYYRHFLCTSRPLELFKNQEKFLDVSQRHKNIKDIDKPIMIIASGPSIQNQGEWISKNQDKFIIVSILSALKFCNKYDIRPDLVIQVDEFEHAMNKALENLDSIDFLNNSIFILSSIVDPRIIEKFKKNIKYFFQSMYVKHHKEFGEITSPSVGEIIYKILLLFGFKEIYLMGIDLAIDAKTHKTHEDEHEYSQVLSSEYTMSDESFKIDKSTFKVKGNFLDNVLTTSIFSTSIHHFNKINTNIKQSYQNVYNTSNGALLEGCIPTKIEDIKIKDFSSINKKDILKSLNISLSNISESSLNQNNINILKQKLQRAYEIKKNVDNYNQIKNYSNQRQYLTNLINLIVQLKENDETDELPKILTYYFSYTSHYIIYFFNIKEVTNHKRHIKKINKILIKQLYKIVDKYIQILEKYFEETS